MKQIRHEPTECSIDGCDRRSIAWTSGQPLCGKHHARWRRNGDPLLAPKLSVVEDTMQMMKEAVYSRPRNECWVWEGRRTANGYGRFGKDFLAHQVVLEIDGFSRPEFPYDKALHSCDNKWCWNPDHLRWGSTEDNAKDYAERWGYCPHCDHCNREDG